MDNRSSARTLFQKYDEASNSNSWIRLFAKWNQKKKKILPLQECWSGRTRSENLFPKNDNQRLLFRWIVWHTQVLIKAILAAWQTNNVYILFCSNAAPLLLLQNERMWESGNRVDAHAHFCTHIHLLRMVRFVFMWNDIVKSHRINSFRNFFFFYLMIPIYSFHFDTSDCERRTVVLILLLCLSVSVAQATLIVIHSHLIRFIRLCSHAPLIWYHCVLRLTKFWESAGVYVFVVLSKKRE